MQGTEVTSYVEIDGITGESFVKYAASLSDEVSLPLRRNCHWSLAQKRDTLIHGAFRSFEGSLHLKMHRRNSTLSSVNFVSRAIILKSSTLRATLPAQVSRRSHSSSTKRISRPLKQRAHPKPEYYSYVLLESTQRVGNMVIIDGYR